MVTAEKTMDEFEKLLEESFSKQHAVADIVEGTVMKKESDGYLVSVKGAKMEAYLPNKELSSEEPTLEIGDEKEFYVLKEEDLRRAGQLLKEALEEYAKLPNKSAMADA